MLARGGLWLCTNLVLFIFTLMSEFESHPPMGFSPITEGETQGAEETSETSPQATSEAEVHPEETSGDSQENVEESTSPAADEPTPFYEEGGKKFSSFDEYREHTNKQRGAAARIAHEKNLVEQQLQQERQEKQQLKDLLDKALTGNKPAPTQEEEDPEVAAAVEVFRKKGFLTRDEVDQILQEKVAPFKQHADRLEKQQIDQAKAVVDEFINLNPDTLEHADQIQRTLKALEDAGLPGGIEKAYYMVTNRKPKSKSDEAIAAKQEVRAVKAAQAGGATSHVATGAPKEKDVFDSMFSKY